MKRAWRRTPIIAVAAVLLVLIAAATAGAQADGETRLGGKVRAGDEVVVTTDETVPGNLYVTGGTIDVRGDVDGDLVAAGGRIRVTGTVAGDALLAGGAVSVEGDVGGSTRVAGGDVTIAGETAEDLVAAAGRLRTGEAGEVGADVLFSAGQARLDGAVAGDVLGFAGDYAQGGAVTGTVDVTVATPEEEPSAAERLLDRVQRYVGLLVIGALLLLLAPRMSRQAAGHLRRRPLLDLGVGAVAILGVLVAGVALLIVGGLLTVVFAVLGLSGLAGLSITTALLAVAVLSFAVVVVWVFVAPLLVGLVVGGYALDIHGGWPRAFAAMALGTLVLVVVFTIPYLGALVALLVAALGFGALVMSSRERTGGEREPVAGGSAGATPAR